MATKTFNVSFPTPLAKRLDRAARNDGRNRSELLRSLVLSYLERKERWNRFFELGYEKSKELGIRTMDDVDRLVHEVRDEMASEERARIRSQKSS